MVDENKAWFVADRSMALTALLFTNRNDVVVRTASQEDVGADLWVTIKEGDAPPTKTLVVQVKGTLDPDPSHLENRVKQLFPSGKLFLPACVFVVDVRMNKANYAWTAEPTIVENRANLSFFEKPNFHPVDEQAVDQIVNRVKAWYDAVPHELISKS